MRVPTEIEVDGEIYVVTHFTTTRSLEVLSDLVKLAGEPIASLFSEDGDMLDIKLEKVLPKAVRALVGNISKTETVALIKNIVDSTSHNGQSLLPTFDIKFSGKIGHLLKLLMAILKVQYGDLKNVLGVLATLQATNKAE